VRARFEIDVEFSELLPEQLLQIHSLSARFSLLEGIVCTAKYIRCECNSFMYKPLSAADNAYIYIYHAVKMTDMIFTLTGFIVQLIVAQQTKKFSAFYGTRNFITVFSRIPTGHYPEMIESILHFFKIHFNIILFCRPSPKWSLLFEFSV
jgi:hypothetical protein